MIIIHLQECKDFLVHCRNCKQLFKFQGLHETQEVFFTSCWYHFISYCLDNKLLLSRQPFADIFPLTDTGGRKVTLQSIMWPFIASLEDIAEHTQTFQKSSVLFPIYVVTGIMTLSQNLNDVFQLCSQENRFNETEF